jgi:hypothetical protein
MKTNRALEAAIRRAYELGRVDESIGVAAEELRRIVAANPKITTGDALRMCGATVRSRHAWNYDWDQTLWTVADVWCDLQRELHGRPARQAPASPYAPLPAREVAAATN